ncbi:MAG: hypothetical protein Q8P41_20010 [Pseudomonadota bacterium]|nr:hypothetical protein [Pseudomonadota bacterium]
MTILAVLTALAETGTVRTFVLTDGSEVVGDVIDEGETAYLVRTRTGVVRVLLIEISDVRRGTEPGVGTVHISKEGFAFPSAQGKAEYDASRLELQVLDSRHGSWGALTTQSSARGGVTSSSQTGTHVDLVVPQYRIATGEGVVLADFTGEWLNSGKRLFAYLGESADFQRHGHFEGAQESDIRKARIRRTSAWLLVLGGTVVAGAGAAVALSDPDADPIVSSVLTAGGLGGTVAGTVWAVTTEIPEPQAWFLDPWSVTEVMPYVRRWNEASRARWGVQ